MAVLYNKPKTGFRALFSQMSTDLDVILQRPVVARNTLMDSISSRSVVGRLVSMPPPLIGRGIKRCFFWRLSLSRTSGLSREHRCLRRPKLAHVTRNSDTTFKVKRSKVKATRPLCSPPCWRVRRLQRRENVLAVGNCWYVAVCSAAEGALAPTGNERGGAYHGGRPPAACL